MNSHETFQQGQKVKTGSDRSFGFVFSGVFLLIGLSPLVHSGSVRVWALAVGAGFGLIGAMVPSWLSPLNRSWAMFGQLLHRVVSPVILGVVLYFVVTPTGWIMRFLGKDPLRLQFQPEISSYWIPRNPPGPEPKSMSNQF